MGRGAGDVELAFADVNLLDPRTAFEADVVLDATIFLIDDEIGTQARDLQVGHAFLTPVSGCGRR